MDEVDHEGAQGFICRSDYSGTDRHECLLLTDVHMQGLEICQAMQVSTVWTCCRVSYSR